MFRRYRVGRVMAALFCCSQMAGDGIIITGMP
jgi:RNase P/RNase MRP subunit POP5